MRFHSKVNAVGTRQALVIDWRGITVEYQRSQVGGGFYIRNLETIPWPWRRAS